MISFTKNPRPEIWPVKEEHSFPEHQYHDSKFANQNRAAISLKYHSDREFQKRHQHKSPGPAAYIIPQFDYQYFKHKDFAKDLTKVGHVTISSIKQINHLPLTKKQSHLKKPSNFSKEQRNTIFSGKYKLYETQFKSTNAMGKDGNNETPAPIYDTRNKPYVEKGNVKRSFSTEKRPFDLNKDDTRPAPGQYFMNKTIVKAPALFSKQSKTTDFAKY